MKDWLEQKLPLLFSYLYVPINNSKGLADSRWETMIGFEPKPNEKSKLTQYWNDNATFIIAELDAELEALFSKGHL
jgi:hypothetical protein